jgi:N-acetylglucosamine kinase-like BadF-type ATPase
LIALGVDGGASKTFAVTADETGRLRGFGRGGCGNYEGPGLEAAMAEVLKACSGALEGARVERAQAGCFGLAGADFPEDFEMLEAAVRKLAVADDVRIYNDTRIAFHAGSRRGYGAVVIMGSGMNAAAFAPDGRECRLPGEGYLFGDWGGAGSVGREALHFVFRAHDGRGRPTALTPLALQHLMAADMGDLTRKLYRGEISSQAIAGLALLAFRAAAGGDEVARVIVDRLADETASAALAMLRRLGMQHDECDVVLGGGIYKGAGPLLVDRARSLIFAGAPRVDVIVPDVEPVIGAAILALQQAGVTLDNQVRANLKQGNDELVAPQAVPSLDDRCESESAA